MNIRNIDHIVLTVTNISTTCDFYSRVLGMEVTSFGNGRKALSFGNQKINLHQNGLEIEPKADHPAPGSADICFISDTSMPDIIEHLRNHDIEILLGPVERTGACGPITSVYFRDPDGNLLEVSNVIDN